MTLQSELNFSDKTNEKCNTNYLLVSSLGIGPFRFLNDMIYGHIDSTTTGLRHRVATSWCWVMHCISSAPSLLSNNCHSVQHMHSRFVNPSLEQYPHRHHFPRVVATLPAVEGWCSISVECVVEVSILRHCWVNWMVFTLLIDSSKGKWFHCKP